MENRLEILEPGDLTAMICLDTPEMQRIAIEQLGEMGYKVHTGFSLDDILLKLRAQTYHLLLVSEPFCDSTSTENNTVLKQAISAPSAQRHKQFIVLVGAFTTNDELQAFEQSVDLVIGSSDFVHLRALLRRGLSRTQEFYAPYHQVLQATGRA
jgi:DNA-binding response OmpR family regulator